MRRWREENLEAIRAKKAADWRADLEGNRLRQRQRYARTRDQVRAVMNAKRLGNPRKTLITKAKERAKKGGLEIALEESDIVIPDVCPILGIPLRRGVGGATENSPTLDRVDSTRGYTPDNVWVISYRANRIKNDSTLQELELLAAAVRAKLQATRRP